MDCIELGDDCVIVFVVCLILAGAVETRRHGNARQRYRPARSKSGSSKVKTRNQSVKFMAGQRKHWIKKEI